MAAGRAGTSSVKLSNEAYRKFKELLFEGRIRPGQFVSQREFVALAGIPLGPVREALQRLEVEGLVQIVPQRGIQVIEASLRLIRNTYQLRLFIEKEAAYKFAESASEAEISAQEESHRRVLDRAASSGIDTALLEDAQRVDWGFHDAIVGALGNDIIRQIHEINNDRIKLIRLDHGKTTLLTPGVLRHAMNEHLAVIEACRRHDPAGAATAMENHLVIAMRRALGI
jgi:DNA-binding GntR family transcriptional regulator